LKLFRKLLIAGLAFILIVACLAGIACLVKRQVYVAICDLFPVAIDGPVGPAVDLDFDLAVEPRGNAYIASQSEPVDDEPARAQIQLDTARAAIEEGMRDASPEDREIWLSELKDQPPEVIREILSLHRRLSLPQTIPDGSLPANDGLRLLSAESPFPRVLAPPGISFATRGSGDAIYLLESSVEVIQSAEQVILNNIANANTAGFKRSRVLFGDDVYRQVALPGQVDQQGHATTSGIALGNGTKMIASQIDVSQGRLRVTKQSLDLAILGEGYFEIRDGNQSVFTRAGTFAINANGQIVLASKDRGRLLEPAITVPVDATAVVISSEGNVCIRQPGQTQMNQIGQIQLARFINPQGLVARGENLFEHNDATGHPQISAPGQLALGEIRQGCLEESNVVVADELAELRRLQEQLRTLQQLLSELSVHGTPR
jgi:flagellar basal-body rod protein FlgG